MLFRSDMVPDLIDRFKGNSADKTEDEDVNAAIDEISDKE